MKKFTISIHSTGESFSCSAQQNVLQAMERSGIASQLVQRIPVGCRGGGCGVCRVRIIDGETEQGKMSKKYVSDAQQQHGLALACRTVPKSDIQLELATPEIGSPERI